MAEFFHMGGYAVYVWSAYGITFLVLMVGLHASTPAVSATGLVEATFDDGEVFDSSRDREPLAQLSAEERNRWQKLWNDIAALHEQLSRQP